jgi:PAS domain S-box-containing protein
MSTIEAVNQKDFFPAPAVPPEKELPDLHGEPELELLTLGRRCNARYPRAEFMQTAARLLAKKLAADFSGVGEVASEGKELRLQLTAIDGNHAAGPSLSHQDSLDPEKSLSGFALRQGVPIASEDLFQEKRFSDPFLRAQGVHGALVVPLLVHQEPCGVVAAYSLQPRPITAGEQQFAETVALMVSSGLAQCRAEEQWRREQKFSQALLGMIDALVLVLNPQGQIEQINSSAMQISGFTFAEVQGKPLVSVFFQPRDEPRIQSSLRSCVRERTAGSLESDLLVKNGMVRRIAWSMQALADDEGPVYAVLMIGVDRTADGEKTFQIERLRSVAEEAADVIRKGGFPEEGTLRLRSLLAKAPLSESPETLPSGASEVPQRERAPLQPSLKEQRRSPRRSFRFPQKIAPLRGATSPSPEQFFEVLCEDLSAGGFSFYLDRRPDFNQLVVMLGQEPEISYLTAQVVRNTPKKIQGREMFLIGCRFNDRFQI